VAEGDHPRPAHSPNVQQIMRMRGNLPTRGSRVNVWSQVIRLDRRGDDEEDGEEEEEEDVR
jgi:hypothetical protein